jgi:16S rRNA U516 pseudouridylate synthase RsuA-like enzyme
MNALQENFMLDLYLNPSNGIRKRYEVVVSRRPTEEILWKAIREINDEGDFLKFEKITQIGRGNMKNLVFEVELAQGEKNEINRVFEHFGIFVKNLKRTRIGNLTLPRNFSRPTQKVNHEGDMSIAWKMSTPNQLLISRDCVI